MDNIAQEAFEHSLCTDMEQQWLQDLELVSKLYLVENAYVVDVLKSNLTEGQAHAIYESLGVGDNKYDGRKVAFIHNTFGKIIKHKGVDTKQIVPQLKDIFDNAVPIYVEAEREQTPRADGKPHKPHNNIVCYHSYLGKIRMGGEGYYVRFTVQQLNTKKKDFIAHQLHSTFITDTSLYNADTVSAPIKPPGTYPAMGNTNGVTDAKLQHFFEKAIAAATKMQKTAKKVGGVALTPGQLKGAAHVPPPKPANRRGRGL
jgi:hypothetical protein